MTTIKQMPTRKGDVLIISSAKTSFYAVGVGSGDGQQDFQRLPNSSFTPVRPNEAEAMARSIVGPGGRIFFRDMDTDEWLEIPT
jgi:hypothetical protein